MIFSSFKQSVVDPWTQNIRNLGFLRFNFNFQNFKVDFNILEFFHF